MESLWQKHEGRRTCIFSTSMFEWRVRMWQNLQMKELHFGTKDLATSTWQTFWSWRKWSMAWIWKKCHCTMYVKLALKANIKGHLFLKMKQLGLSFWNLCIAMCANQWRPHLIVEHDTLSPSSTTFRKKPMFTFWKQKEKCLTNSRHISPWWRIKPTWRSKPCDPTTEENLCPKVFTTFCMNVEFNEQQMHLTHHNKMELRNEPIGSSWNALETWFMHKDLTWSFGPKRWTWRFTSRIDAQQKLLIQKPFKKHGPVQSLMYIIWEFSIAKHMPTFLMKKEAN